ncbi:Galactan beta-1,4-galactosyltransferase gals3 [Dionaea muscipula]
MVKDLRDRKDGENGIGSYDNHCPPPPPASKGDKKLLVGLIWNCALELKFLITALLILCSFATLLQFVPAARLSLSPSSLRSCISPSSTITFANTAAQSNFSLSAADTLLPPSVHPRADQVLPNGALRRAFNPYGSAAYNFILMSAYRGGADTFAVMGLSSKPLQVFGRPNYTCIYESSTDNATAFVPGVKILPDWGYGRVYTVVVVNCTFPHPVGVSGTGGGRLILDAVTNGGGDRDLNLTDTIEALVEPPGSVDLSLFSSPPKYEYLYCGSSLYGDLSPQRVREWMAYHARLFGGRAHFVIHDAGGVHPEVMEVLRPWMELGYVSLHDIREQERFDGYYHNQFLIVNDCLHRYRFMTKWMFFFDVDEYIYVPGRSSLRSVMDSLKEYSQFTIEQLPMSNQLCLTEDAGKAPKKWGLEKLVYRDVKRGIRRDRKYAVQPRDVFATGVHMSQNLQGKTTHKTDRRIKYFHYHGTIAWRREPCRQLINDTSITVDGTPYVLDTTMRVAAPLVKRFELNMIGQSLTTTHQ